MLKGPQPIRVPHGPSLVCGIRELFVPKGIGNFHCELVSEFAFAIFRESLLGDLPGFVFIVSRDDSYADP